MRGELDLTSREAMLKGGESGEPSLVPGKPDASPLYRAVMWLDLEMPPKQNDRLTPEESRWLRDWIQAGAPWPDAQMQQRLQAAERAAPTNEDGELVPNSGGLSDDWTYRRYKPDDLWAFRKTPRTSDLSQAKLTTVEAVDHWMTQRLADAGLKPAGQAAPRALLRRATWDLTGLPPTPEETKAFLAAWDKDSEAAWESCVDRLLASPRYGERWARHWLDVVRYADTGGMSNDYERSNMWRYRDYVIRAFNEDKPYDQFIVEQLAGDELAEQSVQARHRNDPKAATRLEKSGDYTPQEAEWIVATGFLRLGPWDNAMVMADEARQMYLDDVVNITGQAFLGQTLRCCKCHDHKFDPIPTRDYYRIYAAFATTQMAERPVRFLDCENRDEFEQGKAHVQRMLDFAIGKRDELVEKRERAARAWFDEHDLPYQDEQARRDLPDEQKPPRHVGLDYVDQGRLKVREQDVWIWTRRLERYQPMAQSVYSSDSFSLAWNGARKLRINRPKKPGSPIVSHILLGGSLKALGQRVQPGVLSALGLPVVADREEPFLVSSQASGRRTELANWIAHPENGLATRAIVNRIWQSHFGEGLAANPNNLGAAGAKPTHPELLDYLAADLVEHDWKLKRLHRAIMLSEAYRRAATPVDAELVANADPNNQLLSYFPRRRLTAEEIRDGVLHVTGELQFASGGPPVMPEINMEVALQPRMIQFSLAPAYQPSPTPELRKPSHDLRLSCSRSGRPVPRVVQPAQPERVVRIAGLRRGDATGVRALEQRHDHGSLDCHGPANRTRGEGRRSSHSARDSTRLWPGGNERRSQSVGRVCARDDDLPSRRAG